MTPIVTFSHVWRWFRQSQTDPLLVLSDVSLHVLPGQFVTLIGPSGCGKSTLLRMLAGLDRPDQGNIHISGTSKVSLLGVAGYMPQRDLLMPWRTVLDNAALGLEFQGVKKREARTRAYKALPRFGLEGFASVRPATLSGGMRQRVALLRTLLAERSFYVFDEPFGALDAITRAELQAWFSQLLASLATTVVLVTHDLEEAVYLSDVVYVLSQRPGHIVSKIPIALPRPRPYAITTTPEFAAIKGQLWQALQSATSQGIASNPLLQNEHVLHEDTVTAI